MKWCCSKCGKVIVMDVGFPWRAFHAKSMTTVERNKSHQFKPREDTPHCIPLYRICENDWRNIMSDALKLLLKKLHPIYKHLLLWVQLESKYTKTHFHRILLHIRVYFHRNKKICFYEWHLETSPRLLTCLHLQDPSWYLNRVFLVTKKEWCEVINNGDTEY